MTFSLTEESVLDAFASDQRMVEKCAEICQDLVDKKYEISSFVESLGFALTSQEVALRVNGTKFLSLTLAKLPTDYLNAVQLDLIVVFYCDRLKDHHNVIPAIIDGITYLVEMKHLTEGSVSKIVTHFFQHVSCQSQNREDREKIYNLIKRISASHTKELQTMGTNYIYNVMNAIDGERDPRNLVLLFDFMPEFIQQFPLQHLSEEMFETFACYFPVDFHPMKDDPKSLSRDILAEKLSYCLVASSEFADWAIPLALEKMESDLIVAKTDSLVLLTRCSEKFSADAMDQHFDEIWKRLKSEILPGSGNNDVLLAAFNALNSILQNANTSTEASKNMQTKVLSNIIPYVSNPSHHLFASAIHTAEICVRNSTAFAGEKILAAVVLNFQEETSSLESNVKLLAKTCKILNVCAAKESFTCMNPAVLKEIQKTLLEGVSAKDSDTAFLSWKVVGSSLGIFGEEERNELYRKLTAALTNDSNEIDLSVIISNYAEKHPEEMSSKVIAKIYEEFGKLSISSKRNVYLNIVFLARIPSFEEKIMSILTEQSFDSGSEEEVRIALAGLEKLLKSSNDQNLAWRVWFQHNMLGKFKVLISTHNLGKDTLTTMSSILSLLVRQLSVKDQQTIVDQYVGESHSNSASDLFIMHGILGHMDEKVSLGAHFSSLLTNLVQLCMEIEDDVVRTIGHSLLCSLVNRIEKTEENHAILKNVISLLREEIKKGKKVAVQVLAWIGKGLIVRGYENSGEILEDMSELLDHPTLAESAEFAFDIISAELPQLHLPIMKFLYKQKVFHIVLNKLWEKLLRFEERHVNAFAFVLGRTPHTIVKTYLEKVGPIIFKCIESSNSNTVQVGLNVIKNFLREKSDYFRTHFAHLIAQLLRLSKRANSMGLRIGALECLELICQYPVFSLQPYKVDVVLDLASNLDDKKRLVRNAAVKTRNAWFLVGTDKSAASSKT